MPNIIKTASIDVDYLNRIKIIFQPFIFIISYAVAAITQSTFKAIGFVASYIPY